MKTTLLTFVLLTFVINSSVHAANPEGEKPFSLNKTLLAVKSKQGAILSEEKDLWRIDIDSEAMVYFFTKEAHFAYPSLITRKIIDKKGSIEILTKGYTNADKKDFENWLSQFKKQDRFLLRNLQEN